MGYQATRERALAALRARLDDAVLERFFPNDIAFCKADQDRSCYPPRITYCLFVDEGDMEEDIVACVASVVAQRQSGWELVVVGPNSRGFEIARQTVGSFGPLGPHCTLRCLDRTSSLAFGEACAVALEEAHGFWFTVMRPSECFSPLFSNYIARFSRTKSCALLTYASVCCVGGFWGIAGGFRFQPDRYLEDDYLGLHVVFDREALLSAGNFDVSFDTACVYDAVLRLFSKYHVGSLSEPMAFQLGFCPQADPDGCRRAIERYFQQRGIYSEIRACAEGKDGRSNFDGISSNPLVSIVVPSKDNVDDLETLVASVETRTTYRNFEIIVLENNSADESIEAFHEMVARYPNVRLCRLKGAFNYSRLINYGRRCARGEYLLMLNNDMEVLDDKWLVSMLELACRPEVGVVGGLLLYPDDTIQHAGVLIRGDGGAYHFGLRYPCEGFIDEMISHPIDCSAVTGACQLVSMDKFDLVGGYDEAYLANYSDIDFCYKLQCAGYRTVMTPKARLRHYESKTLGRLQSEAAVQRFLDERTRFVSKFAPFFDRFEMFEFDSLEITPSGMIVPRLFSEDLGMRASFSFARTKAPDGYEDLKRRCFDLFGEVKVVVLCHLAEDVAFARRQLESILRQETSFTFEARLFFDGNNHNITALVEEYRRRFPGIVMPFGNDKHDGGKYTAASSSSEYYAFLGKNDIWADPVKLQAQYHVLSTVPDVIACVHGMMTVDGSMNEATGESSMGGCGMFVAAGELVDTWIAPICGWFVRRAVLEDDQDVQRAFCEEDEALMTQAISSKGLVYYNGFVQSFRR